MIAALVMDAFPLQCILRFYLDLHHVPVGVVQHPDFDGAARLIALSEEALEWGIALGGTVSQARNKCPEIQILPRQHRLEESALDTLRQVALGFSPRFDVGTKRMQGWVCVDLKGLQSLMGDLDGIAEKLKREVIREGLNGSLGLGPTASLARFYARCGYLSSSKPPDSFWDDVSIGQLEVSDKMKASLSRFGIRTVSEFLALPAETLADRLGAEALTLHQLIREEVREVPLSLCGAEEEYRVEYECLGGMQDLNTLGALLEEMMKGLMKRLERRGLQCAGLDIWLTFDEGEWGDGMPLLIQPARPLRDVRLFSSLLALRLKKNPPQKEVGRVTVTALVTKERRHQLNLFASNAPQPEGVETSVLNLQTLCGIENVGVPMPANSFEDDAFSVEPFGAWLNCSPQPFSGSAGWALRRYRPPLSCRVSFLGKTPRHVQSEFISGDILYFMGPYRRFGQWWTEPLEKREEIGFGFDWYDMCLRDHCFYRLRYDWRELKWWIVGWYD